MSRLREHPPRLPAEFRREQLAIQLGDDYAGWQSETVPASARRPWWHLAALWITLAAGVAELALGFRFYQAGYSLARAVAAGAAGGACYLAYALPAAWLGSRTGRTAAMLARPVFGTAASGVISLLLAVAALARVAVASVVLAVVWQALFGGGHLVAVAVAATVAGAVPSLLGFTGMAAFARYAAAPLMLAWAGYLVARGILDTPGHVLAGGPRAAALPFAAAVSLSAAVAAWGNEPDTWRYSRPRFAWLAVPYLAALAAGLVLFVAGGWVVASMAHTGTFGLGHAFRSGAGYSVFGLLWLGAVVVTVMQVARCAAGYYQLTSAAASLAGPLRRLRRWQLSALLMMVSALVTWAVITLGITASGLVRVVLWSAVVLPCVVMVMCAEVYVLPRLLAARDPGESERQLSRQPGLGGLAAVAVNWAAIVAVVAGSAFGGFGLGLLPGQHVPPPAGFAPVEAWLLAGVSYAALAVARAARASSRLAPARAERAGGARRKAATAQASPVGMLEAIRSDAAAEAGENQFLALIGGGEAARERLALFALQQARLRSSDRRSFLYLASRSNGPASSFFAGLAETERRALDLLAVFAEALTGRKGPPAGGDALPGCQAYPSFVAWLALNAPPADAALALAATMVTWASQFAAVSRALLQNPGLGLDERALKFFDLIATPAPQVETQALAVAAAYTDTGWPPDRAREYARMLRSYGQMFWVAMAEAPVPATLPAGAAGRGKGRTGQGT